MLRSTGLVFVLALSSPAFAAEYVIDGSGAGMHTAVHFKASHVGISSLWGRFDDVTGRFTYDAADPAATRIEVDIDPASINTNHEERDAHLRTSDYLDVEQYPEARFVSTSVEQTADGQYRITGDFTLHGVTRPITFDAHRTGEGDTPFGDYRVGFEGEVTLDISEWGVNVFPTSELQLWLAIEGIRQ